MAKINPLLGKGTGKVGAFLLQVNSGVQILKEKPVSVANPQTDAQVEQRAKLKLMSQLAAAMSKYIAFRKEGLVSARNKFVSANIALTTFTDAEGAKIELPKIQLTGSNVVLPQLSTAAVSGQNSIVCSGAEDLGVNRVVYNMFKITEDNKVVPLAQRTIEKEAGNPGFPLAIPQGVTDSFVLAYGVMDKSAKSSLAFDNYEANEGETGENDYAVLDVLKSLSVSDYALTTTSGLSLE